MAEMKLEPLRSLNNFLLESARFQVPSDSGTRLENRIKANLIYYQTNYFLVAILVVALFGILRPPQMILGTIITVILVNMILKASQAHSRRDTQSQSTDEVRQSQSPLLGLIGFVIVLSYFFPSWLGSVVVFLGSIIVSVLLIILHAALRTRNIGNKVTNQMDKVGLRKTPMGFLLDELGTAFGRSMVEHRPTHANSASTSTTTLMEALLSASASSPASPPPSTTSSTRPPPSTTASTHRNLSTLENVKRKLEARASKSLFSFKKS